MADNQELIDALLREREGYLRYGKKDRAAAVDKELARLGHRGGAEKQERATAEPKSEKTVTRSRKAE